MARTRTIKPEFWDDEKLSTTSRDARLTFIGIWTNSDDYGVVKGHPAWLKSAIFPYDDIKLSEFGKWLAELESLCCIVPFFHNGERYYHIKNFLKHQTINRPSQAKNPSPPDDSHEHSVSNHGELTDETETETEKEKEKEREKEKSKSLTDEDWLSSLAEKPVYSGLDVNTLYEKMLVWCENNGKKPTRRRFVNWLNREERPLQAKQRGGNNGNNNRAGTGKTGSQAQSDGEPYPVDGVFGGGA
jgi:hypothetical protein